METQVINPSRESRINFREPPSKCWRINTHVDVLRRPSTTMNIQHHTCMLPIAATTNGEPHIITMDGLAYTFNGLGEFWLVRSADFSIQARATVAKNDAGT